MQGVRSDGSIWDKKISLSIGCNNYIYHKEGLGNVSILWFFGILLKFSQPYYEKGI